MSNDKKVNERVIIKASETKRKKVGFKYIELEENTVWKPKDFYNEVMFYFLSGRGYVFAYMQMHCQALSYLFFPDSALWMPRECPFYIKNNGVGRTDIIAVYAEARSESSCVAAPVEKRLQDCQKTHHKLHMLDVFWRASDIENSGGENLFDFELNTFHQKYATSRHLAPPGAEEFMYVIRGEGKIEVGDETFPVKPGSLAYAPPNTYHKVIRDGTDDFFQYLVWIYASEDAESAFPEWQKKAKVMRKRYFGY
jgi:mannose-6-phosphate isomerase-like protein (cupin superfamily)